MIGRRTTFVCFRHRGERLKLLSGDNRSKAVVLENSRKEVIQAHLPVHLPCYDFVPVTSPTFDGALLAVRLPASGVTSSHDVTGGVYKARERIQRTIADARLLATPASCRRVAAYNPNYERLFGIGSTSRLRNLLYRPL